MTRVAPRPKGEVAAAIMGLGGCTSTTIGYTDVQPGRELVMHLRSRRSPATVINHGPGSIVVAADAEGDRYDLRQTLTPLTPGNPGSMRVPLHGNTCLSVSNPRGEGAAPVSFTLVIPDPAQFDSTLQDIPAATPATQADPSTAR